MGQQTDRLTDWRIDRKVAYRIKDVTKKCKFPVTVQRMNGLINNNWERERESERERNRERKGERQIKKERDCQTGWQGKRKIVNI